MLLEATLWLKEGVDPVPTLFIGIPIDFNLLERFDIVSIAPSLADKTSSTELAAYESPQWAYNPWNMIVSEKLLNLFAIFMQFRD